MKLSASVRTLAPVLFLLPAYLLFWHTNDQILSLLAAGELILLLWVIQAGGASGILVRQTPMSLAWLAWLGWLLVDTALSTAHYTSLIYVAILGTGSLTYLGWTWQTQLWSAAEQDLAWTWVRRGLYGSALILFGWAGYQYLHWEHIGMSPAGLRPYGPLLDTNSFAAWMNLLFFPALLLWMEASDGQRQGGKASARVRWGGLGLLALILLTDFSTDSRGGLLSWICTWPWVLWFYWKRPGAGKRLAGIIALAALIFLGFQWSRGFDLVQHMAPSFIDHNVSTVSRWLMWKATWTMYLQHPWFGSGIGTYFLWYPHYRLVHEVGSAGTYAHNDYLQFLMEGGPISLLFLLALAGGLFWGLFHSIRRLRKLSGSAPVSLREAEAVGLLLGVFAITGHALGNFIFYNVPLGFLTGLFVARAWQVLHPQVPAELSGTAKAWGTGLFAGMGLTGIVSMTLLLVSSTLASSTWVASYLPNMDPVPLLVKTNALLRTIDPYDPGPWVFGASLDLEAGKLWKKAGKPQEARIAYLRAYHKEQQALLGIPEDAPVYYTLGMILAQQGKFLGIPEPRLNQEVVSLWKKSIYYNPMSLFHRWELANWTAAHGNPVQGLPILENAYRHPILYAQQKSALKAMIQQYTARWLAPQKAQKAIPGARRAAPIPGGPDITPQK